MNKYTLHKLKEGFIITSDEEIKFPSDIYCFAEEVKRLDCQSMSCEKCKKLIAQQNQIDFSSLSEEEQKKIGWFDIIQFGKQRAIDRWWNPNYLETRRVANEIITAVKAGFQKAQELLSDRMFTVEDMIDFARMCRENDSHKILKDEELLQTTDLFEQWNKMDQPKSWEVKIEMDFVHTDHVEGGFEYFPKLTNGKIKILKLL